MMLIVPFSLYRRAPRPRRGPAPRFCAAAAAAARARLSRLSAPVPLLSSSRGFYEMGSEAFIGNYINAPGLTFEKMRKLPLGMARVLAQPPQRARLSSRDGELSFGDAALARTPEPDPRRLTEHPHPPRRTPCAARRKRSTPSLSSSGRSCCSWRGTSSRSWAPPSRSAGTRSSSCPGLCAAGGGWAGWSPPQRGSTPPPRRRTRRAPASIYALRVPHALALMPRRAGSAPESHNLTPLRRAPAAALRRRRGARARRGAGRCGRRAPRRGPDRRPRPLQDVPRARRRAPEGGVPRVQPCRAHRRGVRAPGPQRRGEDHVDEHADRVHQAHRGEGAPAAAPASGAREIAPREV